MKSQRGVCRSESWSKPAENASFLFASQNFSFQIRFLGAKLEPFTRSDPDVNLQPSAEVTVDGANLLPGGR